MIKLYSGTPGSGKSYHACKDIVFWAKHRRNVITNFCVDYSKIKGVKANSLYLDNADLHPDKLINYARMYHRPNREGECLLVIDEAQLVFNCRNSLDYDRMAWIKFFSQHRKLGYEVILIAQSARMIDRQIRDLIEDDVRHRKLNNYGLFGFFIGMLFLGKSIFYCCDVWMGTKDKVGGQWIIYNKHIADIYDTYKIFDKSVPDTVPDAQRGGEAGVPLRDPVTVPDTLSDDRLSMMLTISKTIKSYIDIVGLR